MAILKIASQNRIADNSNTLVFFACADGSKNEYIILYQYRPILNMSSVSSREWLLKMIAERGECCKNALINTPLAKDMCAIILDYVIEYSHNLAHNLMIGKYIHKFEYRVNGFNQIFKSNNSEALCTILLYTHSK